MRKLYFCIAFASVFLMSFHGVYAEQLETDSHILQIDDSGLGYDDNDPNSTDQSGEYLLSTSLEVFDDSEGNVSDTGDYKLKSGLQRTFEAHVAEVSVLSNIDGTVNLYDRLLFQIDPNGNPTSADGTLFAVQISTDSTFATYYYVNPNNFQMDSVPNSDLSFYYKPCAQTTNLVADDNRWNCGTVPTLKRYIKGLERSTEYNVRIVAMNGDFSNSEPGPAAAATTQNINVTFTLSSTTSTFSTLSIASINTATPSVTVTVDTNASNGYAVSVVGEGSGTGSVSGLYASTNATAIASTNGALIAGIEGYGMQITTNSGTPTLDSYWPSSGNSVGQILRSAQTVFSSNLPSANGGDKVDSTYKAAISIQTPAAIDYRDILTYTIAVSP